MRFREAHPGSGVFSRPERCYGAGLELDHSDHYLFHSEQVPESVPQAGAGQSKRELG